MIRCSWVGALLGSKVLDAAVVAVGSELGLGLRSELGAEVGQNVSPISVGLVLLGEAVGLRVGDGVGKSVGGTLGPNVGDKVGSELGLELGFELGAEVGKNVSPISVGLVVLGEVVGP